ncbi:MAG TPA: hypothetical protein VIQ81_04875 [Gammaproteobacteria bacterium]
MDHSIPATLSTQLSRNPGLVWLFLLLLIGANAALSVWLSGAMQIALICLSFLFKGQLVIDYLMGLKTAPEWIRWPMLLYFYFFSAILIVIYIL